MVTACPTHPYAYMCRDIASPWNSKPTRRVYSPPTVRRPPGLDVWSRGYTRMPSSNLLRHYTCMMWVIASHSSFSVILPIFPHLEYHVYSVLLLRLMYIPVRPSYCINSLLNKLLCSASLSVVPTVLSHFAVICCSTERSASIGYKAGRFANFRRSE